MRRRYEFELEQTNSDDFDLDTSERNRRSIHGVPVYVGFIILAILVGLLGFVNWIDNAVPTPLMLKDEKSYPDAFISERAQHDLKLLTDMGPRIVGSHQNEILAVDFLKREINFIINQKHNNQFIEIDIQVVSGEYFLQYHQTEMINRYSNVQNVIVKLHSKNNSEHSLLVNSHFDSVPTSPGASDDGISVVTMLEVLRKLSRSPDRPEHNIIFLFNGAEETTLQASHGFITKHKWAKECKVLINLEACGSGGKMTMFQSGPKKSWLMKYYNKVPHPYAQAAGEEIFQSGIIPSDTDFRIFRDFGALVGFDMAFYKDGYRYHTKFDQFDVIPLGSYQHIGDNTLSLVKNLANAPELASTNNEEESNVGVIFYDIFGLFMVSYSTSTAIIINSIVVIGSLVIFGVWLKFGVTKSKSKYLLLSIGAILLGWALSFIFGVTLAYILDKLNYSMTWFSNPWLLIGLYSTPTVFISCLPLFFIEHETLSLNVRCQIQAHLVRLIWTVVLLVGTIYGIRSSYALMVPILFNVICFTIIGFTCQHSNFRCGFILVRKWQIMYLLFTIISTMLLMAQAIVTLSLFVPLTGRIGSDKNAEIIIGVMTILFTIIIISFLVPLTILLRNAKYFFGILTVVFLGTLVLVFTVFSLPYNVGKDTATPQRFWISHCSRSFYDENGNLNKTDSGIFMLNMDRNSPQSLKGHLKDYNKIKSLNNDDCAKYPACGLPIFHSKTLEILKYSSWVPANQPILHQKVSFNYTKEIIDATTVKYTINVKGPDRISMYVVPKPNMSFDETLIDNSPNLNFTTNSKTFFIQHIYGSEPADLNVTLFIKTPENWDKPTIDLALTSQHVHERLFVKTPYYENFIKQFPKWADVTAWLSSYNYYII
ncbi:unnamed protein product [Brassicogethes aeneus]|uniref:FXNA-like protease n=1 Tax=Brassicogethes aeneus TaxID=1431903 RepID=A0A9P0FDK7_BRAAE|nr:unnamed protein product [Brassicogethes aeneus]